MIVSKNGRNLLVDDNETLVSSVAQFLLQLDQLVDTVFNKLPLGIDKFFPLFGSLVEESRIHLAKIHSMGIQNYR